MDNNQFNSQSGAPVTGKKLFEYIGMGCSAVGCLLTIIFSIVTCSRGGAAMFGSGDGEFTMSKWIIGVIIAAIIAVVGLVFSILSIEKGKKLSKITIIAIIVAAVAIIYAIIPNATICAYNCVLNG